jgi:hypothetical protein
MTNQNPSPYCGIISCRDPYETPGTGVTLTMGDIVADSAEAVVISNGIYIVNESIAVSPNDTLQLDAGDIVKFDGPVESAGKSRQGVGGESPPRGRG